MLLSTILHAAGLPQVQVAAPNVRRPRFQTLSGKLRSCIKLYQIPISRICHETLILLLLLLRGNMQPRGPQQDNTTTDSESQPNHRHPQPWWQTGEPSNQSLASARLTTNTRQATPLMNDELRSLTPCEVVRDALPAKLANTLLKGLMSDAATWTRGTWYMGGKEHTAPRTSAYYTLHDTQVCSQASQVQLSNLSIPVVFKHGVGSNKRLCI